MLTVKLDGVEIDETQLERLNIEMERKKCGVPRELGAGAQLLIRKCKINDALWHIELRGQKFMDGDLPLNSIEMREMAKLLLEAVGVEQS